MSAVELYRTRIRHVRAEPLRHAFSYDSYSWLVDVDRLDELPRSLAGRFRAADYDGDPSATIAANVRATLAEHGLTASKIRLLSTPRVFGHTFNPLSVFWCDDVVIAEVHNTYRGRHRYVLRPDELGRADTDKALYVSPFYDVSGRYRLSLPEPGEHLRLRVVLHRDGEAPFVASVDGERVPVTPRTVAAALLTSPSLRTSARIRRHGIALWLRGLPVQPRPRPVGAHRG